MTNGAFSHWKPLDFGADGITGSVDAEGRIIALNCYDPVHGYITLTSADPFPDDDRYDPVKVRAYRAGLATLAGFGPTVDNMLIDRHYNFSHRDFAAGTMRRFQGEDRKADVTSWAKDGGAVQIWSIGGVEARFRGRISLQRCAYTQLTEGGVLPMPPLQMEIEYRDRGLVIFNPVLGRAAAIFGFESGKQFSLVADAPVELDILLPGWRLILTYGFGNTPNEALDAARALRQIKESLGELRPKWPDLQGLPDNKLVRRGIIYGWQMRVPVGDTACILTDHMLLPLSWNRDAYYVALALLHGMADGADIVRPHLRWMFTVAERVDGDWGRCYLANGKVKDKAYQLDQQLYPLLELADYTKKTGDKALLEELRPDVYQVLAALERHRDAAYALYATDETPGDDPIALPYHLSSHILLWRTLTQLAEVFDDAALSAWADQVRAAVNRYFVVEAPHPLTPFPSQAGRGGTSDVKYIRDTYLYAYAVDGRGGHYLYHDANDVPLALAPAWGFCGAHNGVWRNTIAFAFSGENPGVHSGRLGSVHTPGPWALGDLQDVIVARAVKDKAREDAAWARLRRGAAIDGALPEAYDAETGAVISRTWFAWPSATAACIALGVWD